MSEQPQKNNNPSPGGKCTGCTCGKTRANSNESVKSNSGKDCKGSFTELVKTNNTTVRYIVHGKGHDGLPDIEISECGESKSKVTTTTGASDGKKDQQVSNSVTASELADIAQLMEDHKREVANRKKQKEERKAEEKTDGGRSHSNESMEETFQKQIKVAIEQSKKNGSTGQTPGSLMPSGGNTKN